MMGEGVENGGFYKTFLNRQVLTKSNSDIRRGDPRQCA